MGDTPKKEPITITPIWETMKPFDVSKLKYKKPDISKFSKINFRELRAMMKQQNKEYKGLIYAYIPDMDLYSLRSKDRTFNHFFKLNDGKITHIRFKEPTPPQSSSFFCSIS